MTTLKEGVQALAAERIDRTPRLMAAELRHWRKAHGMTQAEAAHWVGVSRRLWVRWEQDDRPTPRWLRIIVGLVPSGLGHLNGEG